MLGQLGWRDVAGYLTAQLAGALAGSLAFRALWGPTGASVDGGETHSTIATPAAFLLEAVMTAALVATILAFSSRERLMRWTPVAIVPVIAVLVWQAADLTGTSLNPARSAGPALAFGDLGRPVGLPRRAERRGDSAGGGVASRSLHSAQGRPARCTVSDVHVAQPRGARAELRPLFELAEDSAMQLDSYLDPRAACSSPSTARRSSATSN